MKEQILQFFTDNPTVSGSEIARLFNVERHTVRNIIYSKGYRFGHKTPFLKSQAINISDFLNEIIIGSLLGDGYLSKNNEMFNSKLVIKHGINQEEYADYKYDLISKHCLCYKDFQKPSKIPHYINNILVKEHGSVIIRTQNNQSFNIYRSKWYPENIKTVPSDIKLTPLILAIWFMDDGSLTGGKSTFQLCTNGFDLESINILINALDRDFNIKTTIQKDRSLYIRAQSASLFEEVVNPYMHNSMRYKLAVKSTKRHRLKNT